MKPSTLRTPQRFQPTEPRSKNLHLPGLPRYHPANYASTNSSTVYTSASPLSSPQPTMSPRQQQRQYSEPQKQLHHYQRELINLNRASVKSPSLNSLRLPRPMSPRLVPHGSPGPITPLELEEREGFFFGGLRTEGYFGSTHQAEMGDLMGKKREQPQVINRSQNQAGPSPDHRRNVSSH